MILIKRIYDESNDADGMRVLVDRLWPRGVAKEKAHIDLWLKEIAPSNELRKWFHHETKNWDEFVEKYKTELKGKKELMHQLHDLQKKHKTITLLYGAKDREHNQAIIIADLLNR